MDGDGQIDEKEMRKSIESASNLYGNTDKLLENMASVINMIVKSVRSGNLNPKAEFEKLDKPRSGEGSSAICASVCLRRSFRGSSALCPSPLLLPPGPPRHSARGTKDCSAGLNRIRLLSEPQGSWT